MSFQIHYFKTWPEPFEAAATMAKLHEIRRDDRSIRPAVGDLVVLREWRPKEVVPGIDQGDFTGRELPARRVTYVSAPGSWGLPNDLYVMTLLPEEISR